MVSGSDFDVVLGSSQYALGYDAQTLSAGLTPHFNLIDGVVLDHGPVFKFSFRVPGSMVAPYDNFVLRNG